METSVCHRVCLFVGEKEKPGQLVRNYWRKPSSLLFFTERLIPSVVTTRCLCESMQHALRKCVCSYTGSSRDSCRLVDAHPTSSTAFAVVVELWSSVVTDTRPEHAAADAQVSPTDELAPTIRTSPSDRHITDCGTQVTMPPQVQLQGHFWRLAGGASLTLSEQRWSAKAQIPYGECTASSGRKGM